MQRGFVRNDDLALVKTTRLESEFFEIHTPLSAVMGFDVA